MVAENIKNWSADADSNTTVNGINIAEGFPPANINNAMRAIMASVKSYAANVDGTNFTGTVTKATNIAGGSAGSLPYQTAANTTGLLAIGTAGQLLKVNIGATALEYFTPAYVLNTGNETISGIKTFSSFPITPSSAPTSNYQVANKKYVDDSISSGKVIQQVRYQTGSAISCTVAIPADDTIPQNTEGTEVMTLAITPTSSSSVLVIEVVVIGQNSAAQNVVSALFQDSTANALACSYCASPANYNENHCFKHYMTAGTTSSTTFKVRVGANSGTYTFNGYGGSRLYGGVLSSSITITEYSS